MERQQAFKFELLPSGEQQRMVRRFAGSSRFVHNKVLALQKEMYELGGREPQVPPSCLFVLRAAFRQTLNLLGRFNIREAGLTLLPCGEMAQSL
jgi:helix-turn-helix protein